MSHKFGDSEQGDDVARTHVPLGVRVAAAWSWRFVAIVAALSILVVAIAYLRIVVVPLLVATLLAALLTPVVNRLHGWGWPRGLAVASALVLLLGAVGVMVWVIATQVSGGLADMAVRWQAFYADALVWLADSPWHVTDVQISQLLSELTTSIQADSSALLNGVISVGSTAGHFLTGAVLTLFSLIFLLADSRRIFRWIVGLFPTASRPAVAGAGHAGWRTVSSYVRVQIFVAFVDAVGITIVAAILQLPMLLPIGLFVFLSSFVPFLGAIVSGLFVSLVALVYGGIVPAIVMLGGVIAVQQLESHVLQPFVMGTAVKVHPLAVVLSVTIGALVAGIPGTLFAVPVVAAANVMIGYVNSGAWRSSAPAPPNRTFSRPAVPSDPPSEE